MSDATTKELMTQLQDKLIIKLEENEILCPECKGLTFVLKLDSLGEHGHIKRCQRCHTGKLEVCKHCGIGNKSMCQCKGAGAERREKNQAEQAIKDSEAYQKAEKIHYKDYTGHFILSDSERLKDIDDVSDWISDMLYDGQDIEDMPEYLWAVEGERQFSLDLKDIIYDKCEDGYEEMYSNLDTESPLLSQAQKLINQWQEEQGESLCVFSETYKKAVMIKDLVTEIALEVKGP